MLSCDADASVLPSSAKATARTQSEWLLEEDYPENGFGVADLQGAVGAFIPLIPNLLAE